MPEMFLSHGDVSVEKLLCESVLLEMTDGVCNCFPARVLSDNNDRLADKHC